MNEAWVVTGELGFKSPRPHLIFFERSMQIPSSYRPNLFLFEVIFINKVTLACSMAELAIKHMHHDLESIKQDLAVIKHILSEEGKLSDWAKEQLAKAREEKASSYTDIDDI